MGNSAKPGIVVLVCGLIGLFVAAIEQIAFDNEIILHLSFEAADIVGLQILTIVIWLLIGGILAALSS